MVQDVEIHVSLVTSISASIEAGSPTLSAKLSTIDIDSERRRLKKEIQKLTKLLKRLDSNLCRPAFLERAPGEVVERERLRQTEYRESLARLEASLDAIGP